MSASRISPLLEMLWPETDFEQAVLNFNAATTKLRAALRPTRGQESLLLTEQDARLDTHPAFLRSMRILRRHGVHILYRPDLYPPKNQVSPAVILETVYQVTSRDSSDGHERG